jgi:hypothetical protein
MLGRCMAKIDDALSQHNALRRSIRQIRAWAGTCVERPSALAARAPAICTCEPVSRASAWATSSGAGDRARASDAVWRSHIARAQGGEADHP